MLGLTSLAVVLVWPSLLGQALLAQAPGRAAVLAPSIILILCIVAGIGTTLLLPGRAPVGIRRMGGVAVGAVAVILVALLVSYDMTGGGQMNLYFWIFSAIGLFGAVRVVTHPRPVYSALYFVLTVFATAGLFILLWAEFMAAALVLIYAGAILVTYVFVIMLASQAVAPGERSPATLMTDYDAVSREPLVAATVGFALMGMLLFVIFDRGAGLMGPLNRFANQPEAPVMASDAESPGNLGNTQALGIYLFRDQMVNLELAGLLLTVAMVGAILIARRQVYVDESIQTRVDTVVAGATPIDDDPFSIPVFGTENPRQKAYPET
jgi:NADH-quinone oxidoreductase subunit J